MAACHRCVANRTLAIALMAALSPPAGALTDPFAGLASVRDDRLEQMRGGFENSQGMHFSFAIERAVVVNGELIASTRLVLDDLASLLASGVASGQLISSARSIIQSGAGNIVIPAASSVKPPPRSPEPAAAAVQPASAPQSSPAAVPVASPAAPAAVAVTPAVQAPAAVAAAPAVQAPAVQPAASMPAAVAPAAATIPQAPLTPLVVQLTAGGQTILVPNATAIVSAVQNTLNNQLIETRTSIDAALSSLSALRSHTFSEALRQQALDGIRRP